MIFLSVLILGWKYGAAAAALGGALGDIIGGFAMWAPWTFAVGMVFAVILSEALCRTSAKSFFTYRLKAE